MISCLHFCKQNWQSSVFEIFFLLQENSYQYNKVVLSVVAREGKLVCPLIFFFLMFCFARLHIFLLACFFPLTCCIQGLPFPCFFTLPFGHCSTTCRVKEQALPRSWEERFYLTPSHFCFPYPDLPSEYHPSLGRPGKVATGSRRARGMVSVSCLHTGCQRMDTFPSLALTALLILSLLQLQFWL